MQIHRLFGINLASDFPFRSRLETGRPPADLTFRCVAEDPSAAAELAATGSRASPECGEGFSLHRLDALDVLRWAGIVDYYVGDDRIDCRLHRASRGYLVEIQFLGLALAYWLERGGLPTLHGSAVDVDGSAVAFLSSSSGGKTGLAAALMRRGHALLTDDVLPLEMRRGTFLGRPGYPQLRMWPDQAAHYLENWQDLEIVHPSYSKRRVPVDAAALGSFCGSPRPLACLYLPERRPPEAAGCKVEIVPVRPRDALIELLRHSFSPLIVEAAGWHARRLEFFARLLEHVPVRRLSYPTGFEHLPAVSEAILRDLP